MSGARRTTVEWFGTSTFRVRTAGRTLFFDAFLDRAPGSEPVGLGAAEVNEADFVFVSHAHFDHLYGAAPIARNTGAVVVGSYESIRVLRANGLPPEQVLAVSGGETVDCGGGVTVRVLPSLHSCLFAASDPDSGMECLGDLGVSAQQRVARVGEMWSLLSHLDPALRGYLEATAPYSSLHDGGQLAYLLTTPDGSVFVNGSSGYWSGLLDGLRPDVAIVALNGRPNVDGEPYQGSLAGFALAQVQTLRPETVVFCHHDELLPGIMTAVDVGPAVAALQREASRARYQALRYADAVPVLG